MKWNVVLTSRAKRDLKRLDAPVAERILDTIDRFAETGHGDVRRLKDVDPPEWRLRVGDWRVFVSFQKKERILLVLRVRHRGQAYR